METEDFQALCDDIRKNGVREPIWTYEGKILDGRNRYNACKALGLEPPLRDYTGDSPVALVWSNNGVRRHLTRDQKLEVAHAMLPRLREEAAKRMKRGKALGNDTLPARAGGDQGE